MIIRNFDIVSEDFSEEMDMLLTYMENQLSSELPTTVLTLDYFIYAVFDQRNNLLYDFLREKMRDESISAIRESYFKFLTSKSLNAVKPDRKIIYDEHINEVFKIAKDFSSKYCISNGKISSLHVFLAILFYDNNSNKVRKVFKRAGFEFDETIKMAENYYSLLSMNNEHVRYNLVDNRGLIVPGNVTILEFGGDNENVAELNESNRIKQFLSMANPNIKKRNQKIKYIETYCSNLNELVGEGKIDKLVGRKRETDEIIRVLGRRRKNNIIILGGEGVGKTAIAENIAYIVATGTSPMFLKDKKIISLDMTALMAGTTLRGMFEERVKGLLDEIKANPEYILFIDNIGAVLADKGKNEYDISSMLSRALENGECQIIGTSDFLSYKKTFEKDPSLARRFQKLIIEAPNKKDSLEILQGLKESYENFHHVKYNDDAVEACVNLAAKYITERNLPDSAIDILDEVGSLIGTVVDDEELYEMFQDIIDTKNRITILKANEKYKEADELSKIVIQKERDYNTRTKEKEKEYIKHPKTVTIDDILNVVSTKTGIPVNQLTADDKKKLLEINDRLKSEVVGQDNAIDTICKALKRNRVGLRKSGCLYSLMGIGKSGVGKTLIAKKLAKEMFGSEKALVRFDMSEYPDKTAVNKLIGSNPGYVGYEEGGRLTETVKNKKYCVLLLDEIEKADPEVYNIFLQVLDEGFLTDNSGQKVDFSNVIVIFTSNVGAKSATELGGGIGFSENVEENTKRILNKQLKNRFPPEFLNRIDNVVYFNSLTDDNLKKIICLELDGLKNRMKTIGFDIEYEYEVVDYILNIVSKEKEFGARPIKRCIQDNIEDKITDLLLENEFPSDYLFDVYIKDENVCVK